MDVAFKNLAIILASMVAVVLFLIFIVVFQGSLESMGRYGWQFLITSNWNPVDDEYGAGAAIYGTLITSILALIIAVPLGVGTAIFITENIIPRKIRNVIGVMVELLAAIPSVVLGLWAIFVMEPFIRPALELMFQLFNWIPFFSTPPMGPGTIPAGQILVVMILPIITAFAGFLNQVPQNCGKLLWRGLAAGGDHERDAPGRLWHCWRRDARSGTRHGRNHGGDDDQQLQQFQYFTAGTGNTIAAMLANQFGEADGSQVSSLMYTAFILLS